MVEGAGGDVSRMAFQDPFVLAGVDVPQINPALGGAGQDPAIGAPAQEPGAVDLVERAANLSGFEIHNRHAWSLTAGDGDASSIRREANMVDAGDVQLTDFDPSAQVLKMNGARPLGHGHEPISRRERETAQIQSAAKH